jgi:hypothetical protein
MKEPHPNAKSPTKRFRLFLILTLWSVGLGPLIGGAPFNWLIYPIPFAYFIGGLPALLGGALYGAFVVNFAARFRFDWAVRSLGGALCGAIGCFLASLVINDFPFLRLAMFGAPAGAVCALLYKKAWIERHLFDETTATARLATPVRTDGNA